MSEQQSGDWRLIKQQNPEFFDAVSAAMYRSDPARINLGCNPDEYDPEAGTVIPRLEFCASEDDVMGVLYEEFCRWFGEGIMPPMEFYKELAAEIWALCLNKNLG